MAFAYAVLYWFAGLMLAITAAIWIVPRWARAPSRPSKSQLVRLRPARASTGSSGEVAVRGTSLREAA